MNANTTKKPLSKDELETLKELTQKVLNGDATPEDFHLMTELGTRKAEESKERKGEISNASSIIKVWAITFAELQKELGTSAFHTDAVLSTLGKDAVIAYCDEQGWISSGAPASSRKQGGSDGEKRTRAADETPELIAGVPTPSGKGVKAALREGRAAKGDFGQFVPDGFKNLYLNNPDNLEEVLSRYITPAGKEFFGKPENQPIWDAYIKFIKEGKVGPKSSLLGREPVKTEPKKEEAPATAATEDTSKAQPEDAKAPADEGKKPAAKSSKKAEDKKGDDKKDEKATA